MSHNQIYTCQYPGRCNFDASLRIQRGMHMVAMYVCVQHAEQFRCLTNAEARAASEMRQPVRSRNVSLNVLNTNVTDALLPVPDRMKTTGRRRRRHAKAQ